VTWKLQSGVPSATCEVTMNESMLPRREFLEMVAGAFAAPVVDWQALPTGPSPARNAFDYDAVVIGSGLGGLSCAAAFARQGFRPLVIEQHDKVGGFATAFSRPGGFTFDVSLHATTVGQRDGAFNLIWGFPEITDVEFKLHPHLFRALYPDHYIRVRQRDPAAFVATLSSLFPEEKAGIAGLFDDMTGLAADIDRLQKAKGQVDMSRFPGDFPHLSRFHRSTWAQMMDSRVKDPKLRTVLSSQWGYYGLPPSKLSCFYYALPFLGYLSGGGFYPKGRSQDISNAFARFIESHGGTILLNTRVEKILATNGAASGVATAEGRKHTARVVVSNAGPFATLGEMIDDQALVADYQAQCRQYSVSLSSFQVFLGLKEDLTRKLGIADSEVFYEPSYDPDSSYAGAQRADVENGGVFVTLYDNIYEGYSPAGKNTINLMTLQGYDHWERFAKDYHAGEKREYRREKERMAEVLIRKAEKVLLPGLSSAIEVKEIGTPLTNVRYTGHHRGAIYGWDQTVNNSGSGRVGHGTPIKNLYLAGAWSKPGHGYGAVVPSGLECFGEIMRSW
jgi:all-trans-retinol 13,14-reductase